MKIKALVPLLISLLISCNGNLLFEIDSGADSATTLEIRLRSLWVVGGLSGNLVTSPLAQVDIFDPVTETWYPNVTQVPTPVSFAGVVGYRSKLYVMGGFDGTGTPVANLQIYDIETDTWSDGTAMTGIRANIQPQVTDGYIYVHNGTTGTATAAWAGSNTTYRYNIGSDSWDTRTAPGANRSNLTSYLFGGTMYYLGGRTAAATLANIHDGYTPNTALTDVLTTGVTEVVLAPAKLGMVADVYTPAEGPAQLIVAGGVTLMTGTTGNNPFQGTTVYTPTSIVQSLSYPFSAGAAWVTSGASLPGVPLGHGSGLIHDDTFYFMGGTSTGVAASPPAGSTAVYTSDLTAFPSLSWTTAASMPRGRYGHTVVKILNN